MSTRAQLKEKGYKPLFKGKSNTLPLYMSESNAKKIARGPPEGRVSRTGCHSGKTAMLGDPFWIVMMRRKR